MKEEMAMIVFWGSGDDLIEVTDSSGDEEYNVYGGSPWVFIVGGFYRVYAIFDGCWSFAVSLIDEDTAVPDCKITYERGSKEKGQNDYTMVLTIETDDPVKVFREHREDEE